MSNKTADDRTTPAHKEYRDAWMHFMCVAMTIHGSISIASEKASEALKEFENKFSGPAPVRGIRR
jgi:hypothetical protein